MKDIDEYSVVIGITIGALLLMPILLMFAITIGIMGVGWWYHIEYGVVIIWLLLFRFKWEWYKSIAEKIHKGSRR